jgi:C-terminal processing protease CtpA/Prc
LGTSYLIREKKMEYLRRIKKGAILAVIGTTFFGAYSARAQEAKTSGDAKNLTVTPVQSREPLALQAIFSNQADPEDLSAYRHWTIARLQGPADDLLGATMQPVGDTLQAQLGIPAGQGLVVEGLRGEGASAQAGLQQNDILLSLADKPLGTTDDLIKQLKAAGDSPAPLKILRGGKPVTIRVRPIYRVTLGPVGEQKTEYYIGISAVGPNDAVRAQLGLPEGHGVVVNEVVNGSPAEKVGIKKHDIILELGDKLINSPEKLAGIVQDAKDRPLQLKILRTGKHLTISVTAAARKVEASPNSEAAYRVFLLNRSEGDLLRYADVARLALVNTPQPTLGTGNTVQSPLGTVNTIQSGAADANDLRQRLDHLEKELTAVRAALDKINETLKAKNGNKRD